MQSFSIVDFIFFGIFAARWFGGVPIGDAILFGISICACLLYCISRQMEVRWRADWNRVD